MAIAIAVVFGFASGVITAAFFGKRLEIALINELQNTEIRIKAAIFKKLGK